VTALVFAWLWHIADACGCDKKDGFFKKYLRMFAEMKNMRNFALA
jgi:hypothetical protein